MSDSAPTPVPPLGVVAQRIADVSPSWASASVAADRAPASTDLGIGRDRTIGVESIREGWLLHRGASRIAAAASPDLALLVGDWCYAAGLREVTEHGSLDQVAALAELVADLSADPADTDDALAARWSAALAAL